MFILHIRDQHRGLCSTTDGNTSQTQEENSCGSMEPFLGVVTLLQCKTIRGMSNCANIAVLSAKKSTKFKLIWKRFTDLYCDSALGGVMVWVK